MEFIRKAIRKQFFQLFENYGASSVNDISAPWNQNEPKYTKIKKPNTETFKTIYFGPEITILKDIKDGSKWVYYNESANKDQYFPYAEVEDLSVFTGRDEEGAATHNEEYGDWDLNGDIVQDYINDNVNLLSKGEGMEDYEKGIKLVKIDKELALRLSSIYKDTRLKEVLFS